MILKLVATLILIAGLVDDLKSRKVHNSLFLICLAIALFTQLITQGANGLLTGGLGLACAVACFLPLVLLRALGAGDMKLMMAFGMATGSNIVFWVFLNSLFWAVLFGLLKAGLAGQLKSVLSRNKNSAQTEAMSIPYTLPLLLGWLQVLSIGGWPWVNF